VTVNPCHVSVKIESVIGGQRVRALEGSAPTAGHAQGKDPCVIIWLNGTFGAGKTTTATYLAGRLANARHFDPEQVGYLLMRTLEDHEFKDFQDLPPWRELVPVFTETIARFTGQHLIAVQTVLREDYWHELTEGFKRTQLGHLPRAASRRLRCSGRTDQGRRSRGRMPVAPRSHQRLREVAAVDGIGRRPRHRRHALARRRGSRADRGRDGAPDGRAAFVMRWALPPRCR
jgi:hypothetical protein